MIELWAMMVAFTALVSLIYGMMLIGKVIKKLLK